jgi:hypothetical protein
LHFNFKKFTLFYTQNLGWGNGVTVQDREDLMIQRA